MTKHTDCPYPHHKRTHPVVAKRSCLASGALVGQVKTYLFRNAMRKALAQFYTIGICLLFFTLLFTAQTALASGGTDDWGLNPMIKKITDFLEGSGGKLLGLVGLVIAIYYAAFQLDLKPAGIWFGIAVVILGAPNIVDTVFSAVI